MAIRRALLPFMTVHRAVLGLPALLGALPPPPHAPKPSTRAHHLPAAPAHAFEQPVPQSALG
jgi:hypothetical protein